MLRAWCSVLELNEAIVGETERGLYKWKYSILFLRAVQRGMDLLVEEYSGSDDIGKVRIDLSV